MASVFVHYFQVLGYPGGTRAQVVHMAGFSNKLRCNRMFWFADLNRISNEAYRNYRITFVVDDKH